MRGVIAYPWPFLDHWNPIALYPLIVLPSPHTRLALMVKTPLSFFVCVACMSARARACVHACFCVRVLWCVWCGCVCVCACVS
jgi:hypothetical protein